MRKLLVLFVLMSVTIRGFAAEYFDDRFAPGYDLLEAGQFDDALDAFNELKTEMPDSALVDYSIASTYYQMAMRQEDPEQKEARIETFFKAKEQFLELATLPDPFIGEHAPFNVANCSAQIAKLYNAEEEYAQRLQNLKIALEDYDKILRVNPEHLEAKQNRDHVNYLLKQMLQNPPPEQKKPEEGDGGDTENEGEEQQEGDDRSDAQNPEEEENDEEGSEDEQKGEQDPQEGEDDSEPQSGDTPPQSSSEGKTPEEENIEALLESLEEVNKEEQKNLRRSNRLPQVKGGKWW